VATGFHHVSAPPPLDLKKLYRITLARDHGHSSLVVREVPPEGSSLVKGDVFVYDKGTEVWQLNTKTSAGQERFKAAEFVQVLISERKGSCNLTVFDEGTSGTGKFLLEFGISILPSESDHAAAHADPLLFRLSDSTGSVTFESVSPVAFGTLASSDVFLLDASGAKPPAIFIWIGQGSSHLERRLSVQYAQNYLHQKQEKAGDVQLAIPLVKFAEGEETDAFKKLLGA